MSRAFLWVSENVKVGWIGEALRLPLAEALVPIVAKAQADERARVRRELAAKIESKDIVFSLRSGEEVSRVDVLAALDRICQEEAP